jgi:hypothetical protein
MRISQNMHYHAESSFFKDADHATEYWRGGVRGEAPQIHKPCRYENRKSTGDTTVGTNAIPART